MKTHYLKTWPVFFQAVQRGVKPFEVRKDDREFEEGDAIVLQEYDPEVANKYPMNPSAGYTGVPDIRGTIIYVLMPFDCPSGALNEGFAILGVRWNTGLQGASR